MDTAQAVPIALDRTIAGPLHQQIVACVRAAIASGMLAPGARLPASRVFATQIGVARGMVETAYALLAGAGAIIPARRRRHDGVARSGGPCRDADASGDRPSRGRPCRRPNRLGRSVWACPRWMHFRARCGPAGGAREARARGGRPGPSGPDRASGAARGDRNLSWAVAWHCSRSGAVLVTGGFQGAVALIARALRRRSRLDGGSGEGWRASGCATPVRTLFRYRLMRRCCVSRMALPRRRPPASPS